LERDNMQLSDWLKQTNRTPETMQKELQEEASKRLTLRFAIQWLMEEEKIEASPQEVAALRDQMMATVPEKERSKAEAYYKEGSEGYEELKWRRRVEKLVEGMLAR
jgi:FKBP-type peptidyl-prolyl cis-trans isomerase (trigger factor)